MQDWTLKSICLPGRICVSYTGSPDLAWAAFNRFRAKHPRGTNYADTVAFFEASSKDTNNDYIVAFSDTAKLVTIRDGRRTSGVANTHWIGDKDGYERFREYQQRHRKVQHQGRAVNGVFFMDEMKRSPASELYSIMRNVALDRDIPSVAGFVTVLSNRDIGFRYSVYSDVLFDWPSGLDENQTFQLTDKHDLRATGENDRYSISQISPGYYDMNAVAFYVLKGRLLIVFCENQSGGTTCAAITDVEPGDIASKLDEKLGFQFRAMCTVMSARKEFSIPVAREKPSYGIGMSPFCEVNTLSETDEPKSV